MSESSKHPYHEFDIEIIENIRSGHNKNINLVIRSKADYPQGTLGGRYRAVDRRLQALRKAGKIKYSKQDGWSLA